MGVGVVVEAVVVGVEVAAVPGVGAVVGVAEVVEVGPASLLVEPGKLSAVGVEGEH